MRPEGIEPSTCRLEGGCSIQLSYGRLWGIILQFHSCWLSSMLDIQHMFQPHHARLFLAISILVSFCYLSIHPPIQAISALRDLLLAQAQQNQSRDLKTIFSQSTQDQAPFSDQFVRVVATGDVSLGRAVNVQTIRSKDPRWPFLHVAQVLKESDITFINLEGPLPKNCPPLNDGMKLCGNQLHIQGLQYAGIDVVNVANNHIGDFGQQGIVETETLLRDNGITPTGQQRVVYKESKQTTFAFLGYNAIQPKPEGISWAIPEQITPDIQEAKKVADVVIVTFHWGIEYQEQPTEQQISLGHLAIDSGADVVIGNHPHWIQPMELYKGKPIFYALGNFIFDQEWSQKTKEGMLAKLWFSGSELKHIQLLPVFIERFGQATLIENEEDKNALLQRMYNASLVLEKRIQQRGEY